jgi:hypothetical protein
MAYYVVETDVDRMLVSAPSFNGLIELLRMSGVSVNDIELIQLVHYDRVIY